MFPITYENAKGQIQQKHRWVALGDVLVEYLIPKRNILKAVNSCEAQKPYQTSLLPILSFPSHCRIANESVFSVPNHFHPFPF